MSWVVFFLKSATVMAEQLFDENVAEQVIEMSYVCS